MILTIFCQIQLSLFCAMFVASLALVVLSRFPLGIAELMKLAPER